MKLLVVGGSGFIGRHLLQRLASEPNRDVTATFHDDAEFPAFVKGLGPGFNALRHHLLDTEQGAFDEYDAAVYLAGNSNHTWALTHTDADMMLNAVGLARFLTSFKGDLVLVSTGAVYYGLSDLVSPASPVAPLFPYAASKLAGELLAGWAAAEGRLRSLKVIRLYYAYGPGEESRRLIRRALHQFGVKREPRFQINGTGESVMAPMHVTDVARAIELALTSGSPGTYDLPSSRHYTVRQIVEMAAAVCGLEPKLEFVPSDESTLTFFSELAPFAKEFGFEPKLSLEAGMKSYLDDLRNESTR